ncbi:hypothetical protein N5I87_15495 [Ralstonia sp. CHL-2022]|uniref:7-cyano-7-deazaguanine synthase n=1 Tax=Ralstonia mojiangensis TaxID=2953895 RepID=A0AAE3I599_9RALS|nr:hypothetical protein [Ralstonia mojiangensis]MCT7317412.1 hypothetical protein [Ralstonia mojiangensis]
MNRTEPYRIHVLEKQGGRHNADLAVVLDEDIVVNPSLLTHYCYDTVTGLTHDLMALIGAVKLADRAVTRHHASGWSRHLIIRLPVFEKAHWQSSKVKDALEQCLQYLTGDTWEFEFAQRRRMPNVKGQQDPLKVGIDRPVVFIPYSHGLDSYAQYALLRARAPETEIVCVQASAHDRAPAWRAYSRRAFRDEVPAIPVPVVLRHRKMRELSFRTRPFTYYLLAAYGAVLLRTGSVLIPENAQGSLGGSLVPGGAEAKHRSCYPGFTRRLGHFLHELTGRVIEFEHPALFRTKGQVLQDLQGVGVDLATVIDEHFSCSYDARLANAEHKRMHCGVCGNCLLRRIAEQFANVIGATSYLYGELSAPQLEAATESTRRNHAAFCDVARNSARDMQRLTDLAGEPNTFSIHSLSVDLARWTNRPREDVHRDIMLTLTQHANEWGSFLASCGPASWLAHAARGTYGY